MSPATAVFSLTTSMSRAAAVWRRNAVHRANFYHHRPKAETASMDEDIERCINIANRERG